MIWQAGCLLSMWRPWSIHWPFVQLDTQYYLLFFRINLGRDCDIASRLPSQRVEALVHSLAICAVGCRGC